jgi:hypothetical protein
MVERWATQRFEDQTDYTLRTRTEMVYETLVCSPLNHLTRLIARENFFMHSRRESNKSDYWLLEDWSMESVVNNNSINSWRRISRRVRVPCINSFRGRITEPNSDPGSWWWVSRWGPAIPSDESAELNASTIGRWQFVISGSMTRVKRFTAPLAGFDTVTLTVAERAC